MRRVSLAAIAVVASLGLGAVALGQSGAPPKKDPLAEVDLDFFSDRAGIWVEAHERERERVRDRAMSVATENRATDGSQENGATSAVIAASPVTTTIAVVASEATAPPTTAFPTTAPPTPTTLPIAVAAEETLQIAPASEDSDLFGPASTTTVIEAIVVEPPTTTTTAPPGPTEEQWEALRQCESGGNYGAVSPSGRYRGAYQFSRTTWNWLAGKIGQNHLDGVDPATAANADQDMMARELWDIYGWKPWPACSRHLGFR